MIHWIMPNTNAESVPGLIGSQLLRSLVSELETARERITELEEKLEQT